MTKSKRHDRKTVMQNAHRIARQHWASGTAYAACLAIGLKAAWRQFKAAVRSVVVRSVRSIAALNTHYFDRLGAVVAHPRTGYASARLHARGAALAAELAAAGISV